jgi:membrane protein DedA with SNARE-associated domain
MAHSGAGYEDLPATWPFRAAGTLLIVAMVWFCAGYAIKDNGSTLSNHLPVFWALILASVLLVAGGALYNVSRERRRKRTA